MQIKCNLGHLLLLNSIDWRNGLKRIITFLPDYYFGRGKSSSLVNITMELTHRCNHACMMCHYGVVGSVRKDTQEMDFKTIENVILQAKQLRAGFFLTGGEPFLRQDIMQIIKSIKDKGLKCGINTNGTLLDEEKILSMIDMNLDYIIFSVLGTEEIHDEISGVSGSFKKMLNNLKLFSEKRRNTKILLNQVITRKNLEVLHKTVLLAKDTAVDGVRFQHLSYLSSNDISKFEKVKQRIPQEYKLELSWKQYESYCFPNDIAAQEMDKISLLAKKNNVNVIFKPILDEGGMANWYGDGFHSTKKCIYPWVSMRIAPDGDVFCCPIILMRIGNVKEDKVKELFNNDRFKFFRQLLKEENGQFPVCARCCKLYLSPFGKISKF